MDIFPSEWTPLGSIETGRSKANLEILAAIHPGLYHAIIPHRDRKDLVLRCANTGELQLRQELPDGQVRWIAGRESLDHEVRVLGQQARETIDQGADLFFCFGVGLGYIPVRAAQAVWMQPLFLAVIERDPGVMLGMLALLDLGGILQMPNVRWLLGEERIAAAAAFLSDHGLYRHSQSAAFRGSLACGPQEQAADEQVLQALNASLRTLAETHAQREQRLAKLYAPTAKRDLRKILMVDMWSDAPGGKHLRCIQEALTDEGYEVDYQVVPRTGWASKYPGHVNRVSGVFLQLVERLQPDLVFTMEMFRCRLMPEPLIDRINVPWLTYVSSLNGTEWRVGKREHVVFMEEAIARHLEGKGYPRASSVPLAATIGLRSTPLPEWPYGELPLSFFANNFMPSAASQEESRKRFADYPGLFDCLHDLARDFAERKNMSIFEIGDNYLTDWDLSESDQVAAQIFVDLYGNGLRRMETIRALLGYGIRVLGNYWDQVLTPEEMDRCFARPLPVNQEENVYRHSSININVHAPASEMCPNHRFFNVQAVGGFQISDECRGATQFFDPGKEIVLYQTLDELREAIERYRDDPDARRAIAEAGRKRTLREHTYHHRLRDFLPIMREAVSG